MRHDFGLTLLVGAVPLACASQPRPPSFPPTTRVRTQAEIPGIPWDSARKGLRSDEHRDGCPPDPVPDPEGPEGMLAAELAKQTRVLTTIIEQLEQRRAQGQVFVDLVEDGGVTSLHWAAALGDAELARRLIALGADPTLADCFGYTPLDILARDGTLGHNGNVEKFLLSMGGTYGVFERPPDPPPPPDSPEGIREAGIDAETQKLALLVEDVEKRRVHGEPYSEPIQPDMQPLLHSATRLGALGLARRLIAQGADPNAMDMFGGTALDRLNQHGSLRNQVVVRNFLLAIGGTYNVFR